jgi:hypothetical protein
MAFLGFPVARYIDIDDSEAVLRAIQLTDPDVPTKPPARSITRSCARDYAPSS